MEKINQIENTLKLCEVITKLIQSLLKFPHYAKMGEVKVSAIVNAAISLDICPFLALDGGLKYVSRGTTFNVEMSAQTMTSLIRAHKHTISKDDTTDKNICTLTGKRADTGDSLTESFSIEEAKLAGIYEKNDTWKKYPKDMLYARALSRLARRLFPDIIGNCYVDEEISSDPSIKKDKEEYKYEQNEEQVAILTEEQVAILTDAININTEFKNRVSAFLVKQNIIDLKMTPIKTYEIILKESAKEIPELKPVVPAILPKVEEDSTSEYEVDSE